MTTGYEMRWLANDELEGWYASLRAQLDDNGKDGRYFTTLTAAQAHIRFAPEKLEEARAAHRKPVGEPGWLVVLGLWYEGRVVGHVDLKGGAISAERHRCTLGIGIEREHQGKGFGQALMEGAIAWAREAGLAWVDLGVFEGNDRAIALYRKLGFVELGRIPDRYRVDGHSLTDVLMAMRL